MLQLKASLVFAFFLAFEKVENVSSKKSSLLTVPADVLRTLSAFPIRLFLLKYWAVGSVLSPAYPRYMLPQVSTDMCRGDC